MTRIIRRTFDLELPTPFARPIHQRRDKGLVPVRPRPRPCLGGQLGLKRRIAAHENARRSWVGTQSMPERSGGLRRFPYDQF
jgi:hypothetical protein